MKKTALITGASRGIGAACARALHEDGFDVVINYLNSEEKALSLAKELDCRAIKADVSDPEAVSEMVKSVGDVDVLVCNAGMAMQKMLTDTSFDEWQKIFAVNTAGVFNACKAAIPSMVHKKSGRIITVSSIWGIAGASCEAAYSASKAAVIGLTKSLAKELGPSGITVNCVAPGVIDTDMNAMLSEDILDELRCDTPLGRIGTPEDIANLVSFLASDKASFITGQVITSDGGFIL